VGTRNLVNYLQPSSSLHEQGIIGSISELDHNNAIHLHAKTPANMYVVKILLKKYNTVPLLINGCLGFVTNMEIVGVFQGMECLDKYGYISQNICITDFGVRFLSF
jgi:hypothetical protein